MLLAKNIWIKNVSLFENKTVCNTIIYYLIVKNVQGSYYIITVKDVSIIISIMFVCLSIDTSNLLPKNQKDRR